LATLYNNVYIIHALLIQIIMSSCITNEELNRLLMITASATNKESVINRLSIK